MKSRVLPLFSLLLATSAAWAEEIPAPRQAQLLNMLEHDCGSCHGLTLRGGLGPALLPESLAGKPMDYLAATILYGRPGTPMPPWRPFLTPEEAAWLADRILEGVK